MEDSFKIIFQHW